MMKKIISLAMAVCLLFAALPFAFAEEVITVDASWSILVPASPTSYETFAADKLKTILSEVFGAEMAVVSSASDKYIAVGAASEADVSEIIAKLRGIHALEE